MPEIKCPECQSEKVIKSGFRWVTRKKVQQYRCNGCGKLFAPPAKK